jgi:hypothetical protein
MTVGWRDCVQVLSYQDIVAEPSRHKPKAFCGNPICIARSRIIQHCYVPGLGKARMWSNLKPNETICPACKNALYWARHYQTFTHHEQTKISDP